MVWDPEADGFKTPLQQEANVWVKTPTEKVERYFNLFDFLPAAYDAAGADIAVPSHVLGSALYREVKAGYDWLKVHRASESVVDDRNEAMLLGEFNNCLKIC
jgi:arylsulfatase A-like enzyme